MSRGRSRRVELARGLVLMVVLGGIGLAAIETWESRWAWPVDPAWYRLEEADGRVRLSCQDYAPVGFTRAPAEGVRRILVFGGSTTFGFPDRPTGSDEVGRARHGVVGALQASLDRHAPGAVELVDLGVNGGGTVDSLRIARRAMGFGAVGMIIYEGHSEFLGPPGRFSPGLWRFALYRRFAVLLPPPPRVAPGWVGPPAAPTQAHVAAVLDLFRRNLHALIDLAEDAGMPVVLSTQASNLAGFDPSWSTAGDPDVLAGLAARSDDEIRALRAATPDSAELAWVAGQRALARGEEGWEDLRAAADLDALTFRSTSQLNRVVRAVAAERGAVLVEAEAALREAAMGPPGNELFYDWVHPRPAGARLVAGALQEGMVRAGMVDAVSAVPVTAAELGPDERAAVALRASRSWLQWSLVRAHDPALRLSQARENAQQVLAVDPQEPIALAIVALAEALAAGREPPELPPDVRASLGRLHPSLADLLLVGEHG